MGHRSNHEGPTVMQDIVDLEDWGRDQTTAPIPEAQTYLVRLWDGDGFDEKRQLADDDVTGRQLLDAFGRAPADEHELLMLTRDGWLESVDLAETINLRAKGPERFFAFQTDRLLNFVANGRRFPWGANEIDVSLIRRIARIPDDHAIYLELKDALDQKLEDDGVIDLTGALLERIVSRKEKWQLNVQGVLLTLTAPLILVKDALTEAGFDPNAGWIAILKRRGEPKQQVELTDTIDVSLPGLEKLRLTPAEINNGEARPALRQNFALLDKDKAFLTRRDMRWETFDDSGRRWLLLRGLVLPKGFNHAAVDIAIDIPPAYPAAQIDMFHCLPHLTRETGASIAQTEGRTLIEGRAYQQWSRHLNGRTRWNPATDSVMTHIAVIEAALLAEVDET